VEILPNWFIYRKEEISLVEASHQMDNIYAGIPSAPTNGKSI